MKSLKNKIIQKKCKPLKFSNLVIDWIKEKATFNKSVIEENDNVESVLLDKQGSVEINQNDFDVAIKRVQPSSKREGFATVPDITWNDIGALHNVREELATAILVCFLLIECYLTHLVLCLIGSH